MAWRSGVLFTVLIHGVSFTKNREEIKNRVIRYLPDLSIVNLLSAFVLVQRILNYCPNYPTHRLYFGEVETPYTIDTNL